MLKIDSIDKKILEILQKNVQKSAYELSEILHLSPSQINRRRQRLEKSGFLTGLFYKVSAEKLGLAVQAFIQVQTESQTAETHQAIRKLAYKQQEITAVWTLTGEADYMFRVFCPDLIALNRLIQTVLLPHPSIGRVQSQIVMEELKDDTALPVIRS
jgi:DNA-binding Lrp family transcriptional regulator